MLLAIAKPNEVPSDWFAFPKDPFMHPSEIRTALEQLDENIKIVTMNYTVISWYFRKTENDYDNAFVYDGNALVPLTSLSPPSWLAHFDIADLFIRNMLDPWRLYATHN